MESTRRRARPEASARMKISSWPFVFRLDLPSLRRCRVIFRRQKSTRLVALDLVENGIVQTREARRRQQSIRDVSPQSNVRIAPEPRLSRREDESHPLDIILLVANPHALRYAKRRIDGEWFEWRQWFGPFVAQNDANSAPCCSWSFAA